jgi:hypothetical protein
MNPESPTTGLSKTARGFGVALVLAALANSLLVVVKEKSPALQAEMKKLTGHHWITHAVAIVGLFLVSGWVCSRLNGGQGVRLAPGRLVVTLVAGVALASLIILGFYLLAD